MINAKTFETEILNLIDNLYESQEANLEKAAQMFAECIENDGVIHMFGSGHSVGMGIDIKNREGAMIPIHIMETTDFVTKGNVPLEVFKDKTNVFERRPDVADKLYNLYDIRKDDIFVVISNSGINGVVIDIAALAKKNGHKVIIVTSMKHTLAEESRHPSGKKLYEYGDLVIDNCGPHGDALIQTEGIAKVCSVSSICNNLIAQSIAARTCEILAKDGYELPIITADEEYNERMMKKYGGRI